jgi:PhzF family phenazine biosynthesis protein
MNSSPTARRFKQIDVFTEQACLGNALAVVLDADGLDDAAMQRFARWTNLSETTFLLPPTDLAADYRVRIFTPGGELPFAGHPTLGSCHAWLEAGGRPRQAGAVVQQCAKGLVRIERQTAGDKERLAFATPSMTSAPADPAQVAAVAQAFGLQSSQVLAAQANDNGPVWFSLLLESAEAVLNAKPDTATLSRLGLKVGLVGRYADEAGPPLIGRANREAAAFKSSPSSTVKSTTASPLVEVRGFVADSSGVYEDPVTGSLNASLAQWLMASGRLPESYLASQGTCLGRAGQVHVRRDASGQVWVGGHCISCVNGTITL